MGNMLNKIKTYVAFLWKQFYFIKLFFIIFTLLLLYKEYEVFIFEKPTSVSMEENILEPNMPLDIIICINPGFDRAGLQRNGYSNPYLFFMGRNNTGHSVGWTNGPGFNAMDILEDVTTMKNNSKLPKISLKYKLNGKFNFIDVNMTFTRVTYPTGRCLKVLTPQEVKDGIIYGIFLASYGKENYDDKYGEGFTIHLKDPLNSALMKAEPHKMKGTPLTLKDERRGYLNYNTQILQQINLEGESNFRCIFYSEDNKYENCVETNAKKEIREHFPCLPPWMTNNESEWCTDTIELNKSIYYSVQLDFIAAWTLSFV